MDKTGFIATMIRSGTLWCQWFFNIYATQQYKEWWNPVWQKYMNLDFFVIGHAEYPYAEKNSMRDTLKYCVNGYRNINSHRDSNYCTITDYISQESQMVYIYRNPLDQMISMHNHCKNHKNNDSFAYGQLSLYDFVFDYALESYIKQFLSWYAVRDQENILLIQYAQLKRNTAESFKKIIQHLNILFDEEKFIYALAHSQTAVLKIVETVKGLAYDRRHDGDTHIHSSEVGQWKDHFDSAILYRIEKRLNKYDLSLDFFTDTSNKFATYK